MLDRKVDPLLVDLLKKYIEFELANVDVSESWKNFYQLIIQASILDQKSRFSVSQLSIILKENNIINHAYLAVLYAHGIYILAMSQQLEIYGKDINP
ncbi:MAG: hypothetical protein EOP34_01640 [Rickettsiales bacterium]|nr:MAG: hypothetical protein EOP34_01640 [Rickettsiales bacterium]